MKRLAVMIFVLSFAPSARADDPRARAQELFDSALADAEAGNFAAACPKFLASQEADPKTSTLLNLANCYERNGQTASAWGAFREAEGLARKAQRTDWAELAHGRAASLEPKLGRLTIAVPSRIEGLTVERDGVRLPPGEWGVAIPVDPGEHVVRAAATGREQWEARIYVDGRSALIEVPVLAEVPHPSPAAAPVVKKRPPFGTIGLVTGAVGAAAMVAGGVVGLVAKSDYDDARDRCVNPRACPADAVADSDGAYRTAMASTVLFLAGTAILASGIVLWFLEPTRRPGNVAVTARGITF